MKTRGDFIISYPDLLLIVQAKGENLYPWLPVRNVTGYERAHAWNKSSIFDMLNNQFDRAVKFIFFSFKTWLCAHLKYEPTINFCVLFYLFNVKFNATTGARSRPWLRQQQIWVTLRLGISLTSRVRREGVVCSRMLSRKDACVA